MLRLSEALSLPDDGFAGALAARVWRPDQDGPSVVALRPDGVVDISSTFATMRDLCEASDPARALRAASGVPLGALEALLANTPPDERDPARPWLLAPIDLQAIKAAGVTFAVSMLERVIEERARGNPAAAGAIRAEVNRLAGGDLARLKPGSRQADHLKQVLRRAELDLPPFYVTGDPGFFERLARRLSLAVRNVGRGLRCFLVA